MPRRKASAETQKKILKAAAIEFSQKGFRAATIAAICQRAGTNIASVNYHFGDKETLYVEAWREAFRHSHELYPSDGGVPSTASPEERLRGWIMSMLGRITNLECYEFEIFHREMANPTGLLDETIRLAIEPLHREVTDILREILGPKATEEEIQLCEMSLRSQCMNPMIFDVRYRGMEGAPRHPFMPKPPLPKPPSLESSIEDIAEHIVCFALEGLRGVRRKIDMGEDAAVPRDLPDARPGRAVAPRARRAEEPSRREKRHV